MSNFQVAHLERLAQESDTVPAVNQIEVHPYFGNEDVRGFDARKGIATEAWSPIAQGKVLDDPVITSIAESVGRSPAQVVLRWHIQRGDVVFPQVRHDRSDKGELCALRLRAEHRRRQRHQRTRQGRGRSHRAQPDTFDYIPD